MGGGLKRLRGRDFKEVRFVIVLLDKVIIYMDRE